MKKLSWILLMVSSLAYAGDPKAPAAGAPAVPSGPPAKPAEVTDALKGMTGTWNCTGKAELGGVMHDDVKGTIAHKADLDGWWIQSSLTINLPKMPSTHITMMTTYDTDAKKWYRQSANSHGGHGVSWGTTSGNKTTWEGDSHNGTTDIKIRGAEEIVSPKEVHVTGEYSSDGGKTWKFDHDVTCKK
jgi:hypothetical protein